MGKNPDGVDPVRVRYSWSKGDNFTVPPAGSGTTATYKKGGFTGLPIRTAEDGGLQYTAGWEGPPSGAEGECQMCGRSRGLSLHHLIPRSERPRGSRSYTARLCKECHKWLHVNFSTREMANELSTIDDILCHPRVGDFVGYLNSEEYKQNGGEYNGG